jgi:hypothetical protein
MIDKITIFSHKYLLTWVRFYFDERRCQLLGVNASVQAVTPAKAGVHYFRFLKSQYHAEITFIQTQ